MLKNIMFIFVIFSFQYLFPKRMGIIKSNQYCVSNMRTESQLHCPKEQCNEKNNKNIMMPQDYFLANRNAQENCSVESIEDKCCESGQKLSISSIDEYAKCPVESIEDKCCQLRQELSIPSIDECAKLPVDPCLGALEMDKIECYYKNMLSKLKCQLHEASQQRIKEFELQMEGMANQKINCEIAAIAAKEEVIRQAMCDELERYDRELRKEECDVLQAKACQLASKIKIEVKEAICNVQNK